MQGHFAVFGKTPALSAAELFATLGADLKTSRVSATGMLFAAPLLPDGFWDRMGGTVKAGDALATFPAGDADAALAFLVDDLAARRPEGRGVFGISVYGFEQDAALPFRRLGARLKAAVAATGRSCRHVTSRDPQLSAVTVRRNGLLEKGVEYCLFADRKEVAVCVTTWVQDYEEFATREYGRPAANAKSGMLPVKLGRAMLNLSGAPRDAVVLDPFCGSGTIVAEALAMGFVRVLGADLEERAVTETEANGRWMRERTAAAGTMRIERGAAERVDLTFGGERVDAVVTEPFLGPPLKGNESAERLSAVRTGLASLYAATFAALGRLLPPKADVVILFPVHRKGTRRHYMEVLPAIAAAGFEQRPLLPERCRHTPGFALSPRGGILYGRPGQFVEREIFRFRKR